MTSGAHFFDIAKGKAAPLYVQRKVTNANDLIAHYKSNGMGKMVPPDQMHVTVAHSSEPLDWDLGGRGASAITAEGGDRRVKPLGDKGALVQHFDSPELDARHEALKSAGAKWDFPSYQPHVTLTYDGSGVDHGDIQPYDGPIVLGPEQFEGLDDDFVGSVVEKSTRLLKVKVDAIEHGIVFGMAMVSKIAADTPDPVDYYDLNVDMATGERVPEHITEPGMFKASLGFMLTPGRVGNEMHAGADTGTYVFGLPVTTDIAKAFGWTVPKTGFAVGYKPTPEVLAKFKSGEYTGFSIEGNRVSHEEIDDGA